jgi:hypothetical protein
VFRLEDELREGESVDGLVLLLRGDEDTDAKLLRQAARLAAAYTYRGVAARGVSLFAAASEDDDVVNAVLQAKLRTYATYRRIAGEPLARLAAAVELLPTFRDPHWTALLPQVGEELALATFLDILGPVRDNPVYEKSRRSRR